MHVKLNELKLNELNKLMHVKCLTHGKKSESVSY